MQAARLLTDTSVSHFYPTLFVMVTDILDMLGVMVWERIMCISESAMDQTAMCTLVGPIPIFSVPWKYMCVLFLFTTLFPLDLLTKYSCSMCVRQY